MKKHILIATIVILSCFVSAQNHFNIIVEDTVAHVTSSVITFDSTYLVLSGTLNEIAMRTFAIREINWAGDLVTKKIYSNSESEFWEGFSNCMKIINDNLYTAGTVVNFNTAEYSAYLYKIGSELDSIRCTLINTDNVWKKAFNLTYSTTGDFYLTGQIYFSDIEKAYMYLIKTDSLGNLIWDNYYGQNYESGHQIIETTDSMIIIGGRTYSFPVAANQEDWYLIKLDTAGSIIWQNGYGKPGIFNYDGPVRGLIETGDSNYVACGGYPALRSDTDTYWDGCLRKVSKDGVLMWERFYRSYFTMTNPLTDWFENTISSLVYVNEELYVLGNWRSGIGRSRGYLQKISESGDICWNREYYAIDNTTNDQYLVSFQPTADNGFILAGYGNSYNTHGYDPPQQAWLVKTDNLGIDGLCYTAPPELNINIALPTTLNCSDTITVYAYIAGKSAPYTIETSIGQVIDSIYYPPLFVPVEIGLSQAEIEYGGNIIYTQQITEATLSNHEWGQCIAKPIEFYTPHTSGSQQISITVTDAYGESKTITKEVFVNDNCGSRIGEEVVNPISLYPNPAVDNLYLDMSGTSRQFSLWSNPSVPLEHEYNVAEGFEARESSRSHRPENAEIYNSVGQLVKTIQISNNLTVINIKDFASGVYQIKITDGDGNVLVRSFEKQ